MVTGLMCEWFATCENTAEWVAEAPISDGRMGMVPVCQRCAELTGVEVFPYDVVGG